MTSKPMKRASFVVGAVAGGLAFAQRSTRAASDTVQLPFENGERDLVVYPQKREMMLLTSRPVQLETPFSTFNSELITPNDKFFVRWHHPGIPTTIDTTPMRSA